MTISFGSNHTNAIRRKDVAQLKRDAANDEWLGFDVEVGLDHIIHTELAPHSFALDVARNLEEEEGKFDEPITYAHDKDRAMLAICPDCGKAPMIVAMKPNVLKSCILAIAQAVCEGYEIRILPNKEAASKFGGRCDCKTTSTKPLLLNNNEGDKTPEESTP